VTTKCGINNEKYKLCSSSIHQNITKISNKVFRCHTQSTLSLRVFRKHYKLMKNTRNMYLNILNAT
jgi:hypothetical protein